MDLSIKKNWTSEVSTLVQLKIKIRVKLVKNDVLMCNGVHTHRGISASLENTHIDIIFFYLQLHFSSMMIIFFCSCVLNNAYFYLSWMVKANSIVY